MKFYNNCPTPINLFPTQRIALIPNDEILLWIICHFEKLMSFMVSRIYYTSSTIPVWSKFQVLISQNDKVKTMQS